MASRLPITNDKLYDAVANVNNNINSVRLELKSDITRLENKFDTLEAGRLTRLEERVGKGEIKQAVSSTKIGILIAAISLVVSAVVTIIVNRTIK